MKLPRISIEVFRDRNTSDTAIELAVRALNEMNPLLDDGLEVIDSGRLALLSYPGDISIDTQDLPTLETRADYGMVMTRSALMPYPRLREQFAKRNEILAGLALVHEKRPYAIVNAKHPKTPLITVKHEFGHLMNLKQNGEHYDNDHHCTREQCTMYRSAIHERTDFCNECSDHMATYAFTRRKKKSGLFRRLMS